MDARQVALVNDALHGLAGRNSDVAGVVEECGRVAEAVAAGAELTEDQGELLALALQGYCMYVGCWGQAVGVAVELGVVGYLVEGLLSWVCYGKGLDRGGFLG